MKPSFGVWIALLVALAPAASARGQTLLRWKLEAGQQLAVDCRQETTTLVAFSGKSAETKIQLDLEMLWTVTGVNDDGMHVTQSIRRLQFKLDSPKAGIVNYDSADKTRPTGQAREIADAIQPLLGAEVAVTMTARGEIVSAKPANESAEKLFAAQPAGDQPGVFSAKTIETLFRHPLAVLPTEAVEDGGSWTSTGQLDTAAGKFDQTTTYRLAGTLEHEGQKVARIDLLAQLTPLAKTTKAAAGGPQLALKSNEQTGHILFSLERGRLVSAEQNQKLSTERPYRETTISVTLTSKQTTTVRPAE